MSGGAVEEVVVDIREVARRAGVSVATASRATNHVSTVSPHLAKRVWKAVNELGYYPNIQARSLASGKTRTFGLIVSEITNPFFSEILHSFEQIAMQNNYEIIVSCLRNDPERTNLIARRMIGRGVDGAAILTFGTEEVIVEHFRSRKIPVVRIAAHRSVSLVANIHVNYKNGIRQAVQHLAALRHTRMAFVTGPMHFESARARKAFFEESIREIGLDVPDECIVTGDHTIDGGSQAFKKIMVLSNRPTAVLCSNDLTAIGLMRAAYDCRVRIPEDLSVVGFDDIRLAQSTTPSLTTVRMSQVELAECAFRALRHEVQRSSDARPAPEHELDTSLILRESTCRANSGNHTVFGNSI